MGFDDANHQEPPERAEYEAWEKSQKKPYCEKHEWPAGMGKPCPDCAELAAKDLEIRLLHTAIDKSNEALEVAIKTQEERDALLLQNDAMRKLLEWMDRKGGLGLDVHARIREVLDNKPKDDFALAICGWCAGTGEMQNRSECPKCKGHGSKVIEKPLCECNYKTVQGAHADGCPVIEKRKEQG
jgi:hypothetical protein